MSESVSPLSGTLVLDLSESVGGQYAGRLLAMNGADVVLLEPESGTCTRAMYPSGPDGTSYLFRHLNQGKRSVALDASRAADDAIFKDLVLRADVILRPRETGLPGGNDRLIDCVVADFPATGPYQSWVGSEMIHYALNGTMHTTGNSDREPLYGTGRRAAYATGTSAYISIVSALWERRRSGAGQRVEATTFESIAAMGQNLVSQVSYNGSVEDRSEYPGFLVMLECRDAWVVMFAIRGWQTMCEVFDARDLLADPRFDTAGDRLANWKVAVARFQEVARTMDADEVVRQAQVGRVSAERVSSLDDLVRSEHWAARRLLGQVGDEQNLEVALRQMHSISGAATHVRGPSPSLDGGRVNVTSLLAEITA